MKRKAIVIAAFVAALALAICVSSPAMAYFTDRHTANGSLKISVEPKTQIHEWYANKTKHLVIKNNEKSGVPVYVRAGVYSALDTKVSGSSNWTDVPDGDGKLNEGKGWYNYKEILQPGQEADELLIEITFPPVQSPTQPDGAVVGDNYNVDVVYEAAPVRYNEKNEPYADWDAAYNISAE